MHAPPYLLPNLTQLMIFVLFNRQIFTIILLAEARNLAQDAHNLSQDACNLAQDARTSVSVA